MLDSTYASSPKTLTPDARVKKERSISPPYVPQRKLVTSGSKFYSDIPTNCRKPYPGYKGHRESWAKREVEALVNRGLTIVRQFFRDDGMVIDWESTKSVWNDTLEPDQYDLASTIQRAHAMNHTEYLSTLSQKRKRPLNSPPQPLRRSLPPSQPAISETSRQPIPTASPLQPRALPPDSVVWFGNGPPLDSQRLMRPIRSELSASPTRLMQTIGSPSSLLQPSRSTMLPSAYREKGLSRVQSIRDALAVVQSPDHFEERAPHPSSLLTPALSVSLPTAVSDLSRKAGSHFEQPTFDPGEDERSPHKSTTPSQSPLDVLDNDTQTETRMLVNSHPTVAQNTPHISPVPQTSSPTITPPGPDQQSCNDFGSSEDWPEDEKETARLETAAVEYLRTYIIEFEKDRSSLASAYSHDATFTYRHTRAPKSVTRDPKHAPSEGTQPPSDPSIGVSSPIRLRQTRLEVVLGLLALESHKFSSSSPITVDHSVVYLGKRMGVLLIAHCSFGTTDVPSKPIRHITMNFVLQEKVHEEGSTDRLWPLVAVAHQMMEWDLV
ncbi:hypothetical protein HETIRDRAFT_478570 [Heterobasidion irregulare TC 32-1]|uniref:NTF2 domain-containing protein n=1 Tax=Heterobasidion irregulare (strain TC 32-1) TaxID=747525 RepID=W4K019_HETIT|nr:uncharacterized protein HETIRDRAFT_478570 [Heterobasidion irregulare TC 32-1]ETW79168.1 hypothetical protein HETIRDRAFT_478570 [Heterobasidion irregulare TC 32-1]